MTSNDFKNILENQQNDLAFIIGNGVNRYAGVKNALSWDELLLKLWGKVAAHTLTERPQGISCTEFYDILDLENTGSLNLLKELCELLNTWQPTSVHTQMVHKIKTLNAPLLTTNYEDTFALSQNKLKKLKQLDFSFSDFYPWGFYQGSESLINPCSGFGIWYINGTIHYHRSIKLGLSHYMGSVEKARKLIGNKENGLYKEGLENWQGKDSWLQIIFSKSLCIIGLGLGENETFLRWLLIERMKFYKKYPHLKKKGWYVCTASNLEEHKGKKFFLERVGIETIELGSYKEIYEDLWR
ncbi:MAG: hypothetical protein U0V72_13220 [Cytophagales bacterium]